VATGEAAVAAKKAEAAAERKDISADQKAVIAAEVAAKAQAEPAGVYLVRVGEGPEHLGQIVFMDPAAGKPIRSSLINSIHLRSLAGLPGAFVAVSGLEDKAGGVKLVKLDKASLEATAEGAADMYPESSILVSGETIYAIAAGADGKHYVAAFAAADLKEKARSVVPVAPYAFLGEAPGGIVAQTPEGAFALLEPETLRQTKSMNP
jgi:hypothetical protein